MTQVSNLVKVKSKYWW